MGDVSTAERLDGSPFSADELAAGFERSVAEAGVSPASARRLHAELAARYREPHRHYHVLAHVGWVLHHLQVSGAGLGDRTAIDLAAWYHDAVYDVRARGGANEAASARLAVEQLGGAGAPPELVTDVARLVRATATHAPARVDEAALCDADLAVLAAGPESYDAYVAAVRAEYRHLDDDAWRAGRAAVLQGLLAHDRLFATPAFSRREHVARANLERELEGLRS